MTTASPSSPSLLEHEATELDCYVLASAGNGNDNGKTEWQKIVFELNEPMRSLDEIDQAFCNEFSRKSINATLSTPFDDDELDDFHIFAYLSDGRFLLSRYSDSPDEPTRARCVRSVEVVSTTQLPLALQFIDALETSQNAAVEFISQHGAQLIKPGRWGHRFLNDAAKLGMTNVCKALIDHGADVHALDPEGLAPIHHAVRVTRNEDKLISLVDTLIDAGACINQKDVNGRQAIHHAAGIGFAAAVNVLHQRGAQLNELDALGFAPIHYSCNAEEYFPAMQALVQAGADYEKRNANGVNVVERFFNTQATHEEDCMVPPGRQNILWLIAKGASVPNDRYFVNTSNNERIPSSEITPRMAAVLGRFSLELAQLLEQERMQVGGSNHDELEAVRSLAQRMQLNDYVALIDSHKAQSVIEQAIATAKSAQPLNP